ncbi:hypothetical protein N5B55_04960 [Ralstonia pickettii]|uniref:hypothetical protein n=1 Tax=Ralstonia pickettii TaxID=329 RepID=UPI00271480EB|nr:hypothetical protein [Ralstonia pickettii]WKZ86304.1 hypothetical protein N5B55_04960 [Ralstonia pickettii]
MQTQHVADFIDNLNALQANVRELRRMAQATGALGLTGMSDKIGSICASIEAVEGSMRSHAAKQAADALPAIIDTLSAATVMAAQQPVQQQQGGLPDIAVMAVFTDLGAHASQH